MKRSKKRRIWVLLLLMLCLTLVLLLVLRNRIAPIAEDLAVTVISDRASDILVEAVGQELESEQIDYDRIVYLEKDIDGNITALRTNMLEINRLKVKVLDAVGERVSMLSGDDLSIALGSLLAPEFFSGRGPGIPIRIITVSSSDAQFSGCLSAAGINQTLHQIIMNVTLTVTVLLPTGTCSVDTTSEVVIAETVLVGTVPDSYVNFSGFETTEE